MKKKPMGLPGAVRTSENVDAVRRASLLVQEDPQGGSLKHWVCHEVPFNAFYTNT